MIRIGIRNNLLYPFLLILFIVLRRIIEILLKETFSNLNLYLLPFLIFFAKFIAGLTSFQYSTYQKKKSNISNNEVSIFGIKLVQPKSMIFNLQIDSHKKIFLLVLFASYFDFVGTLVRKFYVLKNKSLENKLRSFQIIVSAILCHFTIKIIIYKHNMFALILISLCSIIIIIEEIIIKITQEEGRIDLEFFEDLGLIFFSGFGRAFLDTIEKHLFEFDYMSPFKVLMQEGFINCCFTLVLFVFNFKPLNGIKVLTDDGEENLEKTRHILYLIFLLILYFIFSGFKNIYRVITIKLYSPMTRALSETIIDPLIVFHDLMDNEDKEINLPYIIINFICLIIIIFSSLVYNDFIILYCCGLEYNTYTEIRKRSEIYRLSRITDIDSEDNDSEDD